MSIDQPGLERRIRQAVDRMIEQHRDLARFHRALIDAFEAGAPTQVQRALQGYGNALEAHFCVEDDVLFPAIQALNRQHEAALGALSEEHERLRRAHAGLLAALSGQGLGACRQQLESFVTTLAAHERVEEDVLRGATWQASDGRAASGQEESPCPTRTRC